MIDRNDVDKPIVGRFFSVAKNIYFVLEYNAIKRLCYETKENGSGRVRSSILN